MSKKLFVHAGLHKTGSTTIQFYCNKHRNDLTAQGLLYPLYIDHSQQKHQSHLQLIKDINQSIALNQESELKNSHIYKFLSDLAHFARNSYKNILLSAENISSCSRSSLYDLASYLVSIFPDFEIVFLFAFRDQCDLAESLYRNCFRAMVKRQQNINTFVNEKKNYFDYEQRLNDHNYIKAKFNSISFEYFQYPTQYSLLPDFFDKLNISFSSLPFNNPIINKNPSLDCIDCIAKDMLQLIINDKKVNLLYNKYAVQHKLTTSFRFIESIHDPTIKAFLDWDFGLHLFNQTSKRNQSNLPISPDALIIAHERLSGFLTLEKVNI